MASGTWQLEPCSHARVRALADALGARRGDGVGARPARLRRAGRGAPLPRGRAARPRPVRARRHARGGRRRSAPRSTAGERICVHGDYDADGICATALAVLLLRELGADVAWHLPSRFEEGYGLNADTLTRLADEGVDLVLTVDCGITAVAEVEQARSLGLEVVVTDHHRPGERFPDCPVVAPLKGDYPFAGLCGTGVVWKLAEALLGADHPFLERHLDIVALATVADVVPLVDENRALALLGLRRLAQTQKPGLRALMRVAARRPGRVRRGRRSASGSRRASTPSGRLGRPEAALALLLTEDDREAHDARRGARGAEPRAAGGRGADPARGDRRGRVVAGGAPPPPRLRRRGRGLARGRDRHRRLAARRALRPAGRADRRHRRRLEGLGPLGGRLRPARRRSARAPRTSSASAAIAPPPA